MMLSRPNRASNQGVPATGKRSPSSVSRHSMRKSLNDRSRALLKSSLSVRTWVHPADHIW